jgi:hypothetical protein
VDPPATTGTTQSPTTLTSPTTTTPPPSIEPTSKPTAPHLLVDSVCKRWSVTVLPD